MVDEEYVIEDIYFKNKIDENQKLKIKKLIIKNTVEKIDECSFENCFNLEEIIFEEECKIIEIPLKCFFRCYNLKKIDLPYSIKRIQYCSFAQCYNLKIIILRGIEWIGFYNFRCEIIEYFYIGNYIEHFDSNLFYSFNAHYNNDSIKIFLSDCNLEFKKELQRLFPNAKFIEDELNNEFILK